MELIGKQVHSEVSGNMTVEFVGEGGDVVAVTLKKTNDDNLNRQNAEERAKVLMVQIATFDQPEDVQDMGEQLIELVENGEESPAVVSLRNEREAEADMTAEDHLQEGLESSFPASDPVSASSSTISGSGPASGDIKP